MLYFLKGLGLVHSCSITWSWKHPGVPIFLKEQPWKPFGAHLQQKLLRVERCGCFLHQLLTKVQCNPGPIWIVLMRRSCTEVGLQHCPFRPSLELLRVNWLYLLSIFAAFITELFWVSVNLPHWTLFHVKQCTTEALAWWGWRWCSVGANSQRQPCN